MVNVSYHSLVRGVVILTTISGIIPINNIKSSNNNPMVGVAAKVEVVVIMVAEEVPKEGSNTRGRCSPNLPALLGQHLEGTLEALSSF